MDSKKNVGVKCLEGVNFVVLDVRHYAPNYYYLNLLNYYLN